MAIPIFQSFFPTVVKWLNTSWRDTYKVIVHDQTGAPIGLTSQNANGPQGIWAPTPLSAAQISSPTPAMIADLNATFQRNAAPYDRWRSDGTTLVSMDSEGGTFIPPGINVAYYSPLVIYEGHPMVIEGSVTVLAAIV